jgi:hypothetical protein
MGDRDGRVEQAARERLVAFRAEVYSCLGPWADAQFEILDGLSGGERPPRSVAELSLRAVVRRGYGSLYQGLEYGRMDPVRLRALTAGQVCSGRADGLVLFAVDASKVPRPFTRVVADVGLQYGTDARGRTAVVAGWSMQWVTQVGLPSPGAAAEVGPLPGPRDSWTLPVDVRRVPTDGNGNELAAAQIEDLTAALAAHLSPLFLLDGGYCPIFLTQRRPVRAQILVRLRGDRVFRRRPPAPVPGRRGRPPVHGPRFTLDEPDTWGEPDAQYVYTDEQGQQVRTRAWHHLHPVPRARRKWEGTAAVEGTLIHRETLDADGRCGPHLWLWWSGPDDAFDLTVLAEAYRHRFTTEHGFRFYKQELGWTRHTPLEPAQMERWSWLILLTQAQLALIRPLAPLTRLPWESHRDAADSSPRRVRRGFDRTIADLPTPTSAPKSGRPGTGRPPGSKNRTQRTRHKVIKKGRPDNTGHPKGKSPLATRP